MSWPLLYYVKTLAFTSEEDLKQKGHIKTKRKMTTFKESGFIRKLAILSQILPEGYFFSAATERRRLRAESRTRKSTMKDGISNFKNA